MSLADDTERHSALGPDSNDDTVSLSVGHRDSAGARTVERGVSGLSSASKAHASRPSHLGGPGAQAGGFRRLGVGIYDGLLVGIMSRID